MNGMVPLKKRLQGPPFSQSVVLSLSHIRLFVTQAHQASLSFIISWTLLKLMSIESMMPSNHVIICHPLIFLPSIFPNIRVFSKELALGIRWPKYWSFSFSISPFNGYESEQMPGESKEQGSLGCCKSMGSQSVGHYPVTEQQQ